MLLCITSGLPGVTKGVLGGYKGGYYRLRGVPPNTHMPAQANDL